MAEHRDVFALAERRLDLEVFLGPDFVDGGEGVVNGLGPAVQVGSGVRKNAGEGGVVVGERYVGCVGGDEGGESEKGGCVGEEGFDDVDRGGEHGCWVGRTA